MATHVMALLEWVMLLQFAHINKNKYRKFTLDAPGVKVLNHNITPGVNAENGGGVEFN